MDRYTWKDGHFRDRDGNPMPVPERAELCCPRIIPGMPAYRSPIDGTLITTRSQRRYDLEKNGCYEVDPPKKPRGYRNANFARKWGLELSEEARDMAVSPNK